jgi:hypothetical protein
MLRKRDKLSDPLVMRFPERISSSEDFIKFAFQQACVPYMPRNPVVNHDTRLVTVGSCFSANVAKSLTQADFDVTNFSMSERIFTTFALNDFLSGLRDGNVSEDLIDDIEENRIALKNIRSLLEEGCTIILTLGLSMCWFDLETGELIHSVIPRKTEEIERRGGNEFLLDILSKYEMRPTSVEDNKESLLGAIDAIKGLNANNQVILTVSPVPLHLCASDYPILTGDFISKSTLRLAVAEVEKLEPENVHYFPSFEIAKWAEPHFPGYSWGTPDTDGDPRHLDPQLIRLIIQLFVRGYVDDPNSILTKI